MQNMSNGKLSADQRRFVDDLASLLIEWGQPGNAARLFGYLLLRNEPASLDEMARDLEISKSNAWAAAKRLEDQRNIRRLGERGTKRVYYVLADDPGVALRKQVMLLGMMADLLSAQKDKVATGAAAVRLGEIADFHLRLQAAMAAVVMPERQTDAA